MWTHVATIHCDRCPHKSEARGLKAKAALPNGWSFIQYNIQLYTSSQGGQATAGDDFLKEERVEICPDCTIKARKALDTFLKEIEKQ